MKIVPVTYHTGNQLVDPYVLCQKVHLREGMRVADFGCGRTGHLIFPAAKIVGDTGIVYAVDILKDVLKEVEKRSQMEGFINMHTIWSDLEQVGRTSIPGQSLDIIFLVNALVQMSQRENVLKEASRLAKEKARIIIVDWIKKGLSFSPPEEQFVNFEKIRQWARKNNFVIAEEFDVGPFHHGMVLYRHD